MVLALFAAIPHCSASLKRLNNVRRSYSVGVMLYMSCPFEIVMANEILDGANIIGATKEDNQIWSMCQSHLTALHV